MTKIKSRIIDLTAKLLLVFFVATLTSGCEPLRKKFVRQKKKDGESAEFIPVLDPVDYPNKVESTAEAYRRFYSLWQVWDKELVMRVEEQASDKKIGFTFNQVLVQMNEMEKLLTGEKQKKLGTYIDQFGLLQKDLQQPVEFRNNGLIKQKLERIDENFREEFRFKQVEGSLVQ
jgi:hypothetical protein